MEAKLVCLYSYIELHAATQGQHKTQRSANYKQASFPYKCPFNGNCAGRLDICQVILVLSFHLHLTLKLV